MHPGMCLTKATISQHYYWSKLRDEISTHIKVRKTCQKKKTRKMTVSLKKKQKPSPCTDYWYILLAQMKLEDNFSMNLS